MKQNIGFNQFLDAFPESYKNNFTYNGKKALFEYLEQLEDDIGKEIECDIIAFCCEYGEYKNLKEYLQSYSSDIDKAEYEENDDLEGYEKAVLEEIRDKTTLIMIDEESFIIGQF